MGEPKPSWFLVLVVFILDLIAFGLSVGAEQRRSKGALIHSADEEYQWCVYTSDIATGLSVGAFLFLLSSQALVTAATRCLCCGASLKPGGARVFAIFFFSVSWLSFIIAEACLLAGAVKNAKHTRYFQIFNTGDLDCPTIRKSIFAAGAAFTFFSFILSTLYYFFYKLAQENSWSGFKRGDPGVGMTPYS